MVCLYDKNGDVDLDTLKKANDLDLTNQLLKFLDLTDQTLIGFE